MKSKNYVFIVLFLVVSNVSSAQEDIMCSELSTLITINNNSNLPTINYNDGNIGISSDQNTGNIRLTQKMVLLGFTGVELSLSSTASIEDEAFQDIIPFEIKYNPYLQIANLNNQLVKIEMYNTSGQLITKVKAFEENSINISNLSTGLYFVKLSNLNNQQKIFKFLKN